MKTRLLSLFASFAVLLLLAGSVFGQTMKPLQFDRPVGQEGITVFEAPKTTDIIFEGMYINVGGDFTVQFQGLSQSNDANSLIDLSDNMALPTANLNLGVQIDDGMRMHLRTYLSSRHHVEAWVKGGYFQIDNLDFISEGFLSDVMEYTRFRFGMDDINYGDAHFRRSDNAQTIYNPFVGNYIMDSFTTEPFFEVSVFYNDLIAVGGITNGRLNQNPTPGDDGFALYSKLGYDTQLNPDLRLRVTGSVYHSTDESTRDYLYGGDRAGARYYGILESPDDARVSDFLPRFNPGFASQTSLQLNPFVKYQSVEFFGILERASNANPDVDGGAYTQYGAELLYRFGRDENLYIGGRYNFVTGEAQDGAATQEVDRFNIGGGWFFNNNVLTKVEYVTSSYSGDGFTGKYAGAEFSGVVVEALISF